jgi:diguanylate cyclase (GGDEF)-like protein/PAS domain S-box-containing protein
MIKVSVLLVLFLALSTSLFSINLTTEEQSYLKSKKYLSVMHIDKFQPFMFNKNGQPSGYSVDIMKLMGKQINKEMKFITAPWLIQLENLKNGSIDIIPYIVNRKEHQKEILFTNYSHITFSIGFAINKNSEIQSMDDFKGKRIAVVNKNYLHDYLEKAFPHIELLVTSSTSEGIKAVAQNKAFAVIDSIPTLNYFIEEDWLSNLKIDTVNDLGLPLEIKMRMGVSKGNVELKSILEKAYVAIPHQDIHTLKQGWINTNNTSNISYNLSTIEMKYLKKKEKILMCVLPNTLPFEQIDSNGQHKGISADIMKIISVYIDTPIVLVPTDTWTESLYNIKERKCDILPIAMDLPARRKSMNFTKPYIIEPFVIVTKDTELFIKDSQQLSNKKIGSTKNYAFSSVLKNKNPLMEIVQVKNSKDGLEKVRNGDLFGYVDTMPVVGYMMQKHSMIDLKIAGKLEFDIKLAIASRNDEPLLNEIMQNALNTISEDRKRTIIGKWISIKVAQEFNTIMYWQITGVFLIILLAILYKNRAVRSINRKLLDANRETKEQQKMVDKYVLILTTDLKGIITGVNEAYCKVIGFNKSELIGSTHSIMKHSQINDAIFSNMWSEIRENKIWNGEIKNLTKDGKTVWFFLNIEPIFKDGKKIGYRSINENITNKKAIEKLSVTDQLTQLYNRHKLDESFSIEIERAKRYRHSLSMILVDIDHFKLVNDQYGHDIGDETLKSISKIFRNSIRLADIVGRWGGEEFIIIVPDTALEQAILLAEKIRKVIETHNFKEIGRVTASFGVSNYIIDDTKELLVKKADEALYKAKNNGRNRVEVI